MQMVWASRLAKSVEVLCGRGGYHPVPPEISLRFNHGQEDADTIDAGARPCHRPQHPVHLVVDAVSRTPRLVDHQAHAPSVWCVTLRAPRSFPTADQTVCSDYFEVALLLGTCLLVNYITADARTNWVEGLIMIAFYVMIVSVPTNG